MHARIRSVLLSTIAGSLCTCNARDCAWRVPRSAAAPVNWAAAQALLVVATVRRTLDADNMRRAIALDDRLMQETTRQIYR